MTRKKKEQKFLEALNGRNGALGKVNKIKLSSLGGLKGPLVAGRVSSDLLRWRQPQDSFNASAKSEEQ